MDDTNLLLLQIRDILSQNYKENIINVNADQLSTQIGGTPNPYKQFTYTIADGAIQDIFYNFDYARILSFSGTITGVKLRFGNSGSYSDIVGAGIGIKLPQVAGVLSVLNNSGGSITITVGLCVGFINDDRLTVSGNINVVNAAGTDLDVSDVAAIIATQTDVSVGTTATLIWPGDSGDRCKIISNLDAAKTVYVGDVSIAIGTSTGTPIYPEQTIFLPIRGPIYGIVSSGTANVSTNILYGV